MLADDRVTGKIYPLKGGVAERGALGKRNGAQSCKE